MQESLIIVSLTVLSSLVTIGRFMYEYRNKMSCCTRSSASDVVEPSTELTAPTTPKVTLETDDKH